MDGLPLAVLLTAVSGILAKDFANMPVGHTIVTWC